MAIVGVTKGKTFEYVSDEDPCKTVDTTPIDPNDPNKGTIKKEVITEGATKFTLAGLDVFLMGMIYDRSSSITRDDAEGTAGLVTKLNATSIDAVRFGLKKWENFQDEGGNDIPLVFVDRVVLGRTYKAVSDDCLSALGIRRVQELGAKIKDASNVTKAEAKNSDTVS